MLSRLESPWLTGIAGTLICACLVARPAACFGEAVEPASGATPIPVRLAISSTVMDGVNLNDAKAAMGIWTDELLRATGLTMARNQELVLSSDQLLTAIRNGTLDLFCLTVLEYREVARHVNANLVLTENSEGDELVLVARRQSGIATVAGLQGRRLIIHQGPRTCLAEIWLNVLLERDKLAPLSQLARQVSKIPKLSQVVLPVFFGQADACVVTRRSLETISELNPQLARQLRVVATSPELVATLFACHRDYPAHLREPIFDRLLQLHRTPAATQVLTLFQSRGYALRDAGCLRSTNALIDAYERSGAAAAGGRN